MRQFHLTDKWTGTFVLFVHLSVVTSCLSGTSILLGKRSAMFRRILRGGEWEDENPRSDNKHTKFGQVVVRKKSLKLLLPECHILRLKCTKCDSWYLSVCLFVRLMEFDPVFSCCCRDGLTRSSSMGGASSCCHHHHHPLCQSVARLSSSGFYVHEPCPGDDGSVLTAPGGRRTSVGSLTSSLSDCSGSRQAVSCQCDDRRTDDNSGRRRISTPKPCHPHRVCVVQGLLRDGDDAALTTEVI